jgi:hypothetical protein
VAFSPVLLEIGELVGNFKFPPIVLNVEKVAALWATYKNLIG